MLKDLELLTCANIPELVLIRAHFSGLIKKIFLRDAKVQKVQDGSGDTCYTIRIPQSRSRGDRFIRENWSSMEEIVNESFNAILLTLPPDTLGQLVAALFGQSTVIPLYMVSPQWEQDISPVIGDPDIVLCDESKTQVFLIELKIQAKKSNGKFSLQQHTKYSNFIQVLKAEGITARAMLLAPSNDFRLCLAASERDWFDNVNGILLPAVNRIEGRPAFVTNKSIVDFESFIAYHDNQIKKYGLDVKPGEYHPIKYSSFSEFKSALEKSAPHLVDAFSIIVKNSSS